ncbi:sensor histidine kinase [Flavobacterium nitratireducens]|uniref:sensor histidine kinase n=1 Tax=Flavobacterium nitratireducens TaxID=992289 RepID=UPI0024157544|nr:CHASE3 domain-containing protein [Flavobacterium nitratireducens]
MFKPKFLDSISFIRALFLVAFFILIFLASVTYRHIKELDKISDSISNTYEISLELGNLISYIKDAETGHRGYIITKDSLYLEPFINARKNVNQSFQNLNIIIEKNPKKQEELNRIYDLVDKRFSYFKNRFIDKTEFNNDFREGKLVMDSLRIELNNMLSEENKLLDSKGKLYKYNNSNTPLIVFSTFLISILILGLGYLRIIKNYKDLINQNIQLKIFDESSKQAEILGKYGSWLLNIEDKTFNYSDNQFRLLGCLPTSYNPTFENLLEYIHPEDKELLNQAFNQVEKTELLPLIHYRIIKKDTQEIRHFRTTAKIFTDHLGNKKMIGTTQDITDDYHKTELIELRNKELEQNNKELMEFNHVASHDLQEPLRKIQTFISRIEDKEKASLSTSAQNYFERIQEASNRMRILIDDLLQYSRTSRSEKIFENTDLNTIASNATSELSENIMEKKAQINFEKLHKVQGIPFQLEQLFINLIGNSLKYAKEEVAPIITITTKKVKASKTPKLNDSSKKEYIKIVFKDNGLGFEQIYADKIFLLFNRLHGKKDYPGTGVGLAICKKIVENHKGQIFAKGKPNEGAVFEVYLPA